MVNEKLETEIAMATEAGREGLRIWHETMRSISGEKRAEKAFELTETTRQIMLAGIRDENPTASKEEIHGIYVDRLLGFHGLSLARIRSLQAAETRARTEID